MGKHGRKNSKKINKIKVLICVIILLMIAIVLGNKFINGKQNNLSFFGFTATPKPKTLQIFGTKQPDGTYKPFHIYSMRQAIEEGFILDVLKSYMTYKM